MNRAEYLRFRRPYERVVRQLLLELEFFVEDLVGVNIHSITHRLKSFDSALEKSRRLSLPIAEMQDIAGIRVVVATLEEVDIVTRFFSRKVDSKDLTIKLDKVIEKKEGYRARHLVLKFAGHYSRSVYPTLVEVQILTLLQHTFNYISRTWAYKTERTFSNEWRTEFQQLSHDLAEIDKRIAQLQNQVVTSSVSGGDDEPLTPFSYQKMVADIFGESETVDDAVDWVRMLVDLGCDTNRKLRNFFSNPAVLNLREQFLTLESDTGRAFAHKVANMTIHNFFLMFGVNLKASEELLQKLDESNQNGEAK